MDYTAIVESIRAVHQVPNMDKDYVLYYDETNNARVFKLKEEGFNFDESAYFILGGIAFEKGKMLPKDKIDSLLENLQLQKNTGEIKFKHIQQNAKNFITLLGKHRMQTFLKWLNENNVWIHYSYQDNFYFSIVDIIDSLEEASFGGPELNRILKNTLYKYIKSNKDWFIHLMIYYGYPNIKNQSEFISQVIQWIENIDTDNEDFYLEYIRQSIKSHRKTGLVFLKDNTSHILIENFYSLYANAIATYYKSEHIFDEENEIQKKFENNDLFVYGKKSDYKFVKSADDIYIQLSDWTVGILRMWTGFLEENSLQDINQCFNQFSNKQKEALKNLQEIMYTSLYESFGFKHGIGSNDFEEKINYFMEYKF